MTYQVLARKYRPKNFDEVLGQDLVVQALKSSLTKNRLHHCYLFTGTRGVGKTSMARLFAKAMSCERGISAYPCNKCEICLEVDKGNFVDLIEIDAASRTKVEDTREILEQVKYLPNKGRYKVYIIDEIHMLSNHSFNALLKTLEEPPNHIKFLLATTDPNKLPITILSRSLQFHLNNLSKEEIESHLVTILEKENIDFEQEALSPIATSAKGSVRDSLSLMDQAISLNTEGKLTLSMILRMLNITSETQLVDLIFLILSRDGQRALEKWREIGGSCTDGVWVLDFFMETFQKLSVLKLFAANWLDDQKIILKTLIDILPNISSEALQLYYQISLNAKKDIAYAIDSNSGIEMTILRLLAFIPEAQVYDIDASKLSSIKDSNQDTMNSSSQKYDTNILPDVTFEKKQNILSNRSNGSMKPLKDKLVKKIESPMDICLDNKIENKQVNNEKNTQIKHDIKEDVTPKAYSISREKKNLEKKLSEDIDISTNDKKVADKKIKKDLIDQSHDSRGESSVKINLKNSTDWINFVDNYFDSVDKSVLSYTQLESIEDKPNEITISLMINAENYQLIYKDMEERIINKLTEVLYKNVSLSFSVSSGVSNTLINYKKDLEKKEQETLLSSLYEDPRVKLIQEGIGLRLKEKSISAIKPNKDLTNTDDSSTE